MIFSVFGGFLREASFTGRLCSNHTAGFGSEPGRLEVPIEQKKTRGSGLRSLQQRPTVLFALCLRFRLQYLKSRRYACHSKSAADPTLNLEYTGRDVND